MDGRTDQEDGILPPFFTGVKSSSAFCSSGEEDGGESKTIFFVSFFPAVPPVYYNASERKGREQSPLFPFPFSAFNGNNICDRTHLATVYASLCGTQSRTFGKSVRLKWLLSFYRSPAVLSRLLNDPCQVFCLVVPRSRGDVGVPFSLLWCQPGVEREKRTAAHDERGQREDAAKKRRKNFSPITTNFRPLTSVLHNNFGGPECQEVCVHNTFTVSVVFF